MESPNGSNYIHMCRWLRCPPVTSRATSTETGCARDRVAIIRGPEKNSHECAVYTFSASADEGRCLMSVTAEAGVMFAARQCAPVCSNG